MPEFPDTQWSLVRRSGGAETTRRVAFSALARDYRPAILAWLRARLPAAEAEDVAQSFLAASFEHRWWARADAAAGSFRGFLLLMLRRHLARVHAGQGDALPLDALPDPEDPTPGADRVFDARFALVLTARAVERLRADYRARGREALFEQLLPLLRAPPEHGGRAPLAAALGIPANTLTVERKRLRERLRAAVREELRQLCADEGAFARDWAALQDVLAAG